MNKPDILTLEKTGHYYFALTLSYQVVAPTTPKMYANHTKFTRTRNKHAIQ